MTRNPEQMKRLGSALYEAIYRENMAEDGSIFLDTFMIFDVLMSLGGTLIAGDPQFGTPQGIRRWSEGYAKDMRALIQGARDDPNRKRAIDAEVVGKRH